jgi:hypothetical protein
MDLETENKPTRPKWRLSNEFPFVLIQQSIILVLASLILDGGNTAQICFFAFIAYWSATFPSISLKKRSTQ